MKVAKSKPVYLVLHPRTRKILDQQNFNISSSNLQIIEPLSYLEMIYMTMNAKLSSKEYIDIAHLLLPTVKDKALGRDVLTAVSPGQLMVKICHEELVELMGGNEVDINIKGNLGVILMSGLQGSGKTTFSGKLANYLKNKKGKNPLLVACDVYRPAAIDQLHVLGDQLGIEVYSNKEEKNPVKIAEAAIQHAKSKGFNVVIIDTAGRLHNKVNLMNELAKIKRVMERVVPGAPHEVLLVLDGSTGQNAFEQAKQFTLATEVTALAITKLDGTAKGGVVLGISDQFQIPVRYIGVGEGIEDLQAFDRVAFVQSFFNLQKEA